jgi:hypothetical protein
VFEMSEPPRDAVDRAIEVLRDALSYNGAKGIGMIETNLRMAEGRPALHQLLLRAYQIATAGGYLSERRENERYGSKMSSKQAMASLRRQGLYTDKKHSMPESDRDAYHKARVPSVKRPPEADLARVIVAKAMFELWGKQSVIRLPDEALKVMFDSI